MLTHKKSFLSLMQS